MVPLTKCRRLYRTSWEAFQLDSIMKIAWTCRGMPIVSTKNYWCYWHRYDNMFSPFLWHTAFCYQNTPNWVCCAVTCRGRFPFHEVHHSDTKLVWCYCAVQLSGDWIWLPFYMYFIVNVIKTAMWSCFVCEEVYRVLVRICEGMDATWKNQV